MSDTPSTDLDAIAADLQKRVGLNLRTLRERRGLTQDRLAHLADLATRHLQKIEAGQVNVTLRTVARLGAALDVEAGALVAGREDGEQR